jgi:histidinol-phosphate/aromatic aminotransferase/cobyric acid decarboxylase-like protein
VRRRAPTSSSDGHTATLVLTNYPDLEHVELKRALVRYVGVLPQNIAVANDFVPLLEATLAGDGIDRTISGRVAG